MDEWSLTPKITDRPLDADDVERLRTQLAEIRAKSQRMAAKLEAALAPDNLPAMQIPYDITLGEAKRLLNNVPEEWQPLTLFKVAVELAGYADNSIDDKAIVTAIEFTGQASTALELGYSRLKDEPAERGKKFSRKGKPRKRDALGDEIMIALEADPGANWQEIVDWLTSRDGFSIDEDYMLWGKGQCKATSFKALKNRIGTYKRIIKES
jgi:hypothetical protein